LLSNIINFLTDLMGNCNNCDCQFGADKKFEYDDNVGVSAVLTANYRK
jgi:hypothetical protein